MNEQEILIKNEKEASPLESQNKGESKEPKKARKFRFHALSYALILVPSITLGVFIGVKAKDILSSGQEVDAGSTDYQSYYPDYDKVYETYQKAQKKDIANYSEVLSPTEMAEISICLAQKEEHLYSQGVGYAEAGVTVQQIRSTTIRNENLFFEESISTGLVNVADRMYQTNDGDNISVTMNYSKNVNKDTYAGNFTDCKKETFDKEGYIAHMGRLLSTTSSYIVSDQTVLIGEKKGAMYGETKATKTDNGYTINLELDPIKGVSAYAIQMKTISELSRKPPFDYCHLVFELDEKLNLLSLTSFEKYIATKASIPVRASTTSEIRVKFERGGDYKIPELNEPCSYRGEM